jgi:hypothetical protein
LFLRSEFLHFSLLSGTGKEKRNTWGKWFLYLPIWKVSPTWWSDLQKSWLEVTLLGGTPWHQMGPADLISWKGKTIQWHHWKTWFTEPKKDKNGTTDFYLQDGKLGHTGKVRQLPHNGNSCPRSHVA